jgi:putative ABC transport system ATP-binding protein
MAERMREGSGNDSVVLRASGIGKQVSSPEGLLTILDSVDLEVRRGETVALVGPSGAGKTTLLAILAGLDRPTSGQVWLAGQELTSLSEDGRAQLRARRVGFVFQSFHLLPALTALENVMLPLELMNEPRAAELARQTLDMVGLGKRLGHYPKQLSGGEQQRVAIGRAFVTRPEILFADEPTGNLDAATGERIGNLLFDLNQEFGTTLVLVTHEQGLTGRCSRVLRIDGGRMVAA